MYNYKLTIQYDGTRYSGWQSQSNTSNTIQYLLENSLYQICGIFLKLHGSGRTDSGVHAYNQIANFKSNRSYDIDWLLSMLNSTLPQDIKITNITLVDNSFHARLSATQKHYVYCIDARTPHSVFKRKYYTPIDSAIDINAMLIASRHLIGTHDFRSFCTTSEANINKSTIRTIYKIDITNANGLIQIHYYGNGFLYNMVRILSGTLIEVGLGKIKPSQIPYILEQKNRALAGPTAPANALTLYEVFYN